MFFLPLANTSLLRNNSQAILWSMAAYNVVSNKISLACTFYSQTTTASEHIISYCASKRMSNVDLKIVIFILRQ